MLDFYPFMRHTITVAKMTTKQKVKILVTTRSKEAKMSNLTVGSQFVTQKSGVSGIIQEIVQNKNGTQRVRLSVNGQDRWTTVK